MLLGLSSAIAMTEKNLENCLDTCLCLILLGAFLCKSSVILYLGAAYVGSGVLCSRYLSINKATSVALVV